MISSLKNILILIVIYDRLREELNDCNSDLLVRKELAKEQEKMLDQRVLEYQAEKAVSELFALNYLS